nr:unnamed protein product [Digitaria exilis]
MQKAKRGGDDLTTRFRKNRRARNKNESSVGPFQSALEIPHGETLVAIGRGVSGEIVTKSVELDDDSRVSEDDFDLDCKISKAWEGGHVLSMDGKQKKTGLAQSRTLKVNRFGPIVEKSNSHPEATRLSASKFADLFFSCTTNNYSTMHISPAGMILVNTFEDAFGDIHGEGVWRKFSTRASNINSNVVALASFNGEKRFFACTGFIIEWNGSKIILTSASLVRNSGDENKIVENLRIDVLLNNQCIEGTLQHYSLHYNVALAGIGGPLVNLDGDVIGMNFYDKRIGTPLLLWADICKILTSFETKSKFGEVGNGAHFWKMYKDRNIKLNSWPVPMPRWCHPGTMAEDKSDDDDEFGFEPRSGRKRRYSYFKGKKIELY